jgi:hypothetical protein
MSVALLVRAIFWLWFIGAVAAGHWLLLQRLPALALPAIILVLSGALLTAFLRLPGLRGWTESLDTRALVLLHVSRLVGVYFLVLHQRGELPRAFAMPAGVGEIVIAVMALPVVFAPLADASRQRAIRIWSIVGFVTLLLVIFTLTRLLLAHPAQLRALTQLPLSLHPTFLLPLLLATHVVVLLRTTATPDPG